MEDKDVFGEIRSVLADPDRLMPRYFDEKYINYIKDCLVKMKYTPNAGRSNPYVLNLMLVGHQVLTFDGYKDAMDHLKSIFIQNPSNSDEESSRVTIKDVVFGLGLKKAPWMTLCLLDKHRLIELFHDRAIKDLGDLFTAHYDSGWYFNRSMFSEEPPSFPGFGRMEFSRMECEDVRDFIDFYELLLGDVKRLNESLDGGLVGLFQSHWSEDMDGSIVREISKLRSALFDFFSVTIRIEVMLMCVDGYYIEPPKNGVPYIEPGLEMVDFRKSFTSTMAFLLCLFRMIQVKDAYSKAHHHQVGFLSMFHPFDFPMYHYEVMSGFWPCAVMRAFGSIDDELLPFDSIDDEFLHREEFISWDDFSQSFPSHEMIYASLLHDAYLDSRNT